VKAALALLLAACAFAQNPRVGFYQWTSAHPGDALTAAREAVKQAGAGLLRIYVGPRWDYIAERRTRATPLELMKLERYRAALTDPAIPTLVLSVYPGIDYGAGLDDLNLNRPWSAREEKAEYEQIHELAAWLLREHGPLAKTVLIANSEADARLGEIVEYTGDAKLAIANVTAWQRTRHRAIEDARRAFPAAKLQLRSVFEISRVNTFVEGRWNALTAVVPQVPFDVLSYSAYESANAPFETGRLDTPPAGVTDRLLRDWAKLKAATSKPVMIGELGFSLEQFEPLKSGGVLPRMNAALAALRRMNPAYVVFWQAFDMPVNGLEPVRWGLLEPGHPARAALAAYIRQ
jgi:hypothetical protein